MVVITTHRRTKPGTPVANVITKVIIMQTIQTTDGMIRCFFFMALQCPLGVDRKQLAAILRTWHRPKIAPNAPALKLPKINKKVIIHEITLPETEQINHPNTLCLSDISPQAGSSSFPNENMLFSETFESTSFPIILNNPILYYYSWYNDELYLLLFYLDIFKMAEAKITCEGKKKAEYLCGEEDCNGKPFLCRKCDRCEEVHSKCKMHYRFNQLQNKVKEVQRQDPNNLVKKQKNSIGESVKILERIAKDLNQMDYFLRAFGLSDALKQLLYGDISKSSGKTLNKFMNNGIKFVDQRYLMPPLFELMNQELRKWLINWEETKNKIFSIYRKLARVDWSLKQLQSEKNQNESQYYQKIQKQIKTLKQILDRAIKERLQINFSFSLPNNFEQQEIDDFQRLQKMIMRILLDLLTRQMNQKKYHKANEFLSLYNDFFSVQKGKFRIVFTQKSSKVKQYEALLNYFINEKYQQAFIYFSQKGDVKNQKNLQILIKLCQILNLIKEELEYLLHYEKIFPSQKTNLRRIISNLQKLKKEKELREYIRKLINVIKQQEVKKIDDKQELFYLYQKIANMNWKQKKIAAALMDQKSALQLSQELFQLTKGIKWAEITLKLRQTMIYEYEINKNQNSVQQSRKSLKNSINKCEKYLEQLDKKDIKVIQNYYIRFLSKLGKVSDQKNLQYCLKAIQLCQKYSYKYFEPYLTAIMIGYSELPIYSLLDLLQKANRIYSHYECYYRKGLLNFQLFEKKHQAQEFYEAIKCFEATIRLKPGYFPAFYMMGRCYLSQKQYEKAKDFFQLALDNGGNQPNIYSDLAQCLQWIKEDNYLSKCEQLYIKALSLNHRHEKALIGLGRVLKQQKKFDQAEQKLQKVIELNSLYSDLANMYMGNIYEEYGNQNPSLHFQYLQQALFYYKKAENNKKNLENLIRVMEILGLSHNYVIQ